MVDIISKRDGPRREDAEIKQFLGQHRSIITRLADQISNGQYSRSKRPKQAPQPEGLIIHIGDRPAAEPELQPRIRVTANGRVIAVDAGSGRQLIHFGDIREAGRFRTFVLATAANGYVAPLDEDALNMLADIDGVLIGPSYDAGELAADIGRRIDIPWEA